jgi:hypothetical protein
LFQHFEDFQDLDGFDILGIGLGSWVYAETTPEFIPRRTVTESRYTAHTDVFSIAPTLIFKTPIDPASTRPIG